MWKEFKFYMSDLVRFTLYFVGAFIWIGTLFGIGWGVAYLVIHL